MATGQESCWERTEPSAVSNKLHAPWIGRHGGMVKPECTTTPHAHDVCFRFDYGGSQLCVQQHLIREPSFRLKRKRLSALCSASRCMS